MIPRKHFKNNPCKQVKFGQLLPGGGRPDGPETRGAGVGFPPFPVTSLARGAVAGFPPFPVTSLGRGTVAGFPSFPVTSLARGAVAGFPPFPAAPGLTPRGRIAEVDVTFIAHM